MANEDAKYWIQGIGLILAAMVVIGLGFWAIYLLSGGDSPDPFVAKCDKAHGVIATAKNDKSSTDYCIVGKKVLYVR